MVSGGKLAQTRGCGCNMRASDVVSVTWRQLPLFICAERPIPATLCSNDDHEIFITELQTCNSTPGSWSRTVFFTRASSLLRPQNINIDTAAAKILHWTDLISLLILFFFFLLGRLLQKSPKLRRLESDRDEIWRECSSRKCASTGKSDFWFDLKISRWQRSGLWRHVTRKTASTWWVNTKLHFEVLAYNVLHVLSSFRNSSSNFIKGWTDANSKRHALKTQNLFS